MSVSVVSLVVGVGAVCRVIGCRCWVSVVSLVVGVGGV